MDEQRFRPGDAVRQSGVSVVMVVTAVAADAVTCTWTEQGSGRTATYGPGQLVPAATQETSDAVLVRPLHGTFGLGAVVRERGHARMMFVVGREADSQVVCGWIEDGRVHIKSYGTGHLEQVSPFGEYEEEWMDAYRSGWAILEYHRATQR
jgi:uncharacterized protein YodC (DUF2158 family)